jgi:hypothetical protein
LDVDVFSVEVTQKGLNMGKGQGVLGVDIVDDVTKVGNMRVCSVKLAYAVFDEL